MVSCQWFSRSLVPSAPLPPHHHPSPYTSPLCCCCDYYTSLTPPSLGQNLKLLGTDMERITRMLWCKPAPNCLKQDYVKSGLAPTLTSDISVNFHFELPAFFIPSPLPPSKLQPLNFLARIWGHDIFKFLKSFVRPAVGSTA